jgi:HSP20 family molecular chaperone IbpA
MPTCTIEKCETPVTRAELTRKRPVYLPSVDIFEDRDELLLIADVPGATSEHIDIQFENGELTIHARVEPRQAAEPDRDIWREYGVSDFHRTFRLGESIDNAKIHAEVKDGVLTVHLPKTEATKPRKIAVTAK